MARPTPSTKAAMAVVLCCTLAACGQNGGTKADTGGGTGDQAGRSSWNANVLGIVSESPAFEAVQIALDAAIEVEFDGILAKECLAEPETRLRLVGTTSDVPGTYESTLQGRGFRFVPAAPLRREANYEFQLSALMCDIDGRLLEEEHRIEFRTVDSTPPTVVETSILEGATGVDSREPIVITFDEAIDPSSIRSAGSAYLLDTRGTAFDVERSSRGNELHVLPIADLPGERDFVLIVNELKDRSGNATRRALRLTFRTAADSSEPQLIRAWPELDGSLYSPLAIPTLTFDESIDLASIQPGSIIWYGAHGEPVSFEVGTSPNQRRLRLTALEPIAPFQHHVIKLVGGERAITDVSGNPVDGTALIEFMGGDDTTRPQLVRTAPANEAIHVSVNAHVWLTFDKPVDPTRLDAVELIDSVGNSIEFQFAPGSAREVELIPSEFLEPGKSYRVVVTGGPDGIRDLAGNALDATIESTFTTSLDATLPSLIAWPGNGSVSAPAQAILSAVATTPLDPASVRADTVFVTNPDGERVSGEVALDLGGRRIRFAPESPWSSGLRYRWTVRGGPDGVREDSGSWLSSDRVSYFQSTSRADQGRPSIDLTLNEIDDIRNDALVVPPFGFTIDVQARDDEFALDMSTVRVKLTGLSDSRTAAATFAAGELQTSSFRWMAPADEPLAPGSYTVSATVADLSGNLGIAADLEFRVEPAASQAVPFERTQVVWLRTDLDRDGNGFPDFFDDLIRLGLCSAADEGGTNDRMLQVVRDGVLARAHELFDRKPNGGRRGADSVSIRFSHRRPLGVPSAELAVGGFDPEGGPNRDVGDDSTGTLGRAYFDYANGQVADRNIGTNPGLGVFPGEVFLFEAEIHARVSPGFLTSFGRTFSPLAPDLGGQAVGSLAIDRAIVAPDFDYGAANPAARARYATIFRAADDWATVIGTIVAHEVGHTVGLVAEGRNSTGLHGDESLHNEFSAVSDVMSATVGYESILGIHYQFRDINLAYLRHRLLLR